MGQTHLIFLKILKNKNLQVTYSKNYDPENLDEFVSEKGQEVIDNFVDHFVDCRDACDRESVARVVRTRSGRS